MLLGGSPERDQKGAVSCLLVCTHTCYVTKAYISVLETSSHSVSASQELGSQECATTLAQNSSLNCLIYQNLHLKYIQHCLNTQVKF